MRWKRARIGARQGLKPVVQGMGILRQGNMGRPGVVVLSQLPVVFLLKTLKIEVCSARLSMSQKRNSNRRRRTCDKPDDGRPVEVHGQTLEGRLEAHRLMGATQFCLLRDSPTVRDRLSIVGYSAKVDLSPDSAIATGRSPLAPGTPVGSTTPQHGGRNGLHTRRWRQAQRRACAAP